MEKLQLLFGINKVSNIVSLNKCDGLNGYFT